jgi:hypothetical protein
MNKLATKLSLLVLALGLPMFLTGVALGASVEGSVQGFRCVTQGKVCPKGKEDPMAAVENVFVVLTKGKDFYFVPNLDRAVMARHINNRVRVSGTLSSNYNAITANKLEVFRNGRWTVTWDFDMEKIIQEGLSGAEASF